MALTKILLFAVTLTIVHALFCRSHSLNNNIHVLLLRDVYLNQRDKDRFFLLLTP